MTLYFDPFFSPHPDRLFAPLLTPAEAPAADIVLCTHEHWDHLDPATLASLASCAAAAPVVVPEPIVEQVTRLGIAAARVCAARPGEQLAFGGVTVWPIPACHGLNAPPAVYGFGERPGEYRYLGYVVEVAGVRLFHAGDTIAFDGLIERLRPHAIDIALLPINGRSVFREQHDILGNMDERDAVALAARIGTRLLVPIHYDMFARNLGRPDVLVAEARAHRPEVACLVPAHGERFGVLKGDGVPWTR